MSLILTKTVVMIIGSVPKCSNFRLTFFLLPTPDHNKPLDGLQVPRRKSSSFSTFLNSNSTFVRSPKVSSCTNPDCPKNWVCKKKKSRVVRKCFKNNQASERQFVSFTKLGFCFQTTCILHSKMHLMPISDISWIKMCYKFLDNNIEEHIS